jgi:hypothetical protein
MVAWGEGEALVSPKSSYGDFKHVILAVTDDDGKVSVTARKDLIVPKGQESSEKGQKRLPLETTANVPSFHTTASILTGSVYKDSFAFEILQSGLLQRFLFSYYTPSFEKNMQQLNELTSASYAVGEDGEIETGALEKDRMKFVNYFKYDIYPHIDKSVPCIFSYQAILELQKVLKDNFHDQAFIGQKLDTYNSFINATEKHIEKIAVMAAIVDGNIIVTPMHIQYAWSVCKFVFDSYMRLLDQKYNPDYSQTEQIRLGIITKIIKNNQVSRQELLDTLKISKLKSEWDVGYNKTVEFLDLLEERGTLESGIRGKAKYYRLTRIAVARPEEVQ